MTNRKFYRTVVQVEVLSESSIQTAELDALHHMITEGDCSGHLTTVVQEELNGKQAADALVKQASDPSFFNLADNGDDND